MLKVLHLYSDWRWTGPAEPVIQLCQALADKGLAVHLAMPKPLRSNQTDILSHIPRSKSFTLNFDLRLNKHMYAQGLCDFVHDLWTLNRLIKTEKFDIVQSHLSHDFCLVGLAHMLNPRFRWVHRDHQDKLISGNLFGRWMLKKHISHLFKLSECSLNQEIQNIPQVVPKISKLAGYVGAQEFKSRPADQKLKHSLGLAQDAFVIGLVSRLQKRRQLPTVLKALKIVCSQKPNVHFLFIGRGGQHAEQLKQLTIDLGLEGQVHFVGYRKADYQNILSILDLGLFWHPGYDGSCRAALQMISMGIPMLCADWPVLSELNQSAPCVAICQKTETSLSQELVRLIEQPELRKNLSSNAQSQIHKSHLPKHAAEHVRRALLSKDRI